MGNGVTVVVGQHDHRAALSPVLEYAYASDIEVVAVDEGERGHFSCKNRIIKACLSKFHTSYEVTFLLVLHRQPNVEIIMKKLLTITAAAFGLIGCATAPAPKVSILSVFNPQDVVWAAGEGTSGVKGSAVLMTNNGSPRTCAGKEVALIPVSAYSTERMYVLYGSVPSFRQIRGDNISGVYNPIQTINDTPAQYVATARKTKCDAQGNFEFENIPSGDYFVLTQVVWMTPFGNYSQSYNGGTLVDRITLHPNKITKVILSI